MKRKLITVSTDKIDGRRRLVSLSTTGRKLLQEIAPELKVIKEENRKWINGTSHDILTIPSQLEKSLDEKSMYKRDKISLLQAKENPKR